MKKKVFSLFVVLIIVLLSSCVSVSVPNGFEKNSDGLYEKYDSYSDTTIICSGENFFYKLPIELSLYKTKKDKQVLIETTHMETFGILSDGKSGIIQKIGITNQEGEKIEIDFSLTTSDYDVDVMFTGPLTGITTTNNFTFISVKDTKKIGEILSGTQPYVRYFYSNGKYDDEKFNDNQIKVIMSLINTL